VIRSQGPVWKDGTNEEKPVAKETWMSQKIGFENGFGVITSNTRRSNLAMLWALSKWMVKHPKKKFCLSVCHIAPRWCLQESKWSFDHERTRQYDLHSPMAAKTGALCH